MRTDIAKPILTADSLYFSIPFELTNLGLLFADVI